MGIFGFGKKKSDPWDEIFKNCDFDFAKNEIISQMAGGVYERELTKLLDDFINSPTKASAKKLITHNKDFSSFFYNNISRREMMKYSGKDINQPRKSVNLLMQETDFEEFSESLYEDKDRYNLIKNRYLSKGYTQSMIDEAIATYWKDLSGDVI
jgi:hypothetical protein